ncbi:MAG: hypothetical protein LBV28_03780 [Puniceicoccales bacterium]|jgi:hypothetical protein|nr:hypothetical protein [Puniceicoccales bacterium]
MRFRKYAHRSSRSRAAAALAFAVAAAAVSVPSVARADGDLPRASYYKDIPFRDPLPQSVPSTRGQGELTVASAYVFDLGSDAKNQTGWAGSLGFAVLPTRDPEYRDWQIKMGGEFLFFSTTGHRWHGTRRFSESVDAGILYFNAGASYNVSDFLEIGASVGMGIGGSYGESRGIGERHRNGNMDWSLQFRPHVTLHLTETVHVYAGYRASYISPVYRADFLGYRSVDILHQSLEAGLVFKF